MHFDAEALNEDCSKFKRTLFVVLDAMHQCQNDYEMQNIVHLLFSWAKLVRVNPRACKAQLPHRVLELTNFLDVLW